MAARSLLPLCGMAWLTYHLQKEALLHIPPDQPLYHPPQGSLASPTRHQSVPLCRDACSPHCFLPLPCTGRLSETEPGFPSVSPVDEAEQSDPQDPHRLLAPVSPGAALENDSKNNCRVCEGLHSLENCLL